MNNEFDDGPAPTTQTEQDPQSTALAADTPDQRESMASGSDHQPSPQPATIEKAKKRSSASQFEEAELGALMADLIPPSTDPLEEQQNLQRRFREPDELAQPAPAEAIKEQTKERATKTNELELQGPALPTNQAAASNTALEVDEVAPAAESSQTLQGDDDATQSSDATSQEDAPQITEEDVLDEPPAQEDQPDATAADVEASNQALAAESYPELGSITQPANDAAAPAPPETETQSAKSDDADEAAEAATAEDSEAAAEIPAPAANRTPSEVGQFAAPNPSTDRLQDILAELKNALVELTHRPQTAPVDVGPLVQALQSGFERSAEQAAQTSSAVASLGEHMTQFGRNIEGGVTKTISTLAQQPAMHQAVAPAAPRIVDRSTSQSAVLGAVALAVIGWSILFWIKTGSPQLALGTLVGANAIACCLLLARRDRS